MIASTAPADWFEILEVFGQEVLRELQNKRLVIRSGNRLNLYWDIFREYVSTKTVPSIPLTYLPSSPSLNKMLEVAQLLDSSESRSFGELSKLANISEKTVANVIHDLIVFGIAIGGQSQVKLDPSMESAEPDLVLQKLRHLFKHHALTISLSKIEDGTTVDTLDIIELLKGINPAAQHRDTTWKIYAERMAKWLYGTGYFVSTSDGWLFEDQGGVNTKQIPRKRRRWFHSTKRENTVFTGQAPPAKTVEALHWLLANQPQSYGQIKKAGYRNPIEALTHLGLSKSENKEYRVTKLVTDSQKSILEIVWRAAQDQSTIRKVIAHHSRNTCRLC